MDIIWIWNENFFPNQTDNIKYTLRTCMHMWVKIETFIVIYGVTHRSSGLLSHDQGLLFNFYRISTLPYYSKFAIVWMKLSLNINISRHYFLWHTRVQWKTKIIIHPCLLSIHFIENVNSRGSNYPSSSYHIKMNEAFHLDTWREDFLCYFLNRWIFDCAIWYNFSWIYERV